MTDEQIREMLATKVMGWKLGAYQDEKWWFETDVDGYSWRPYKVSDWQPDTNIGQVMRCAEKWCFDNDGTYKLEGGEYGGEGKFLYRAIFIVWMYKSQDYKCYVGEGTKEQAITNALLEAVKK